MTADADADVTWSDRCDTPSVSPSRIQYSEILTWATGGADVIDVVGSAVFADPQDARKSAITTRAKSDASRS